MAGRTAATWRSAAIAALACAQFAAPTGSAAAAGAESVAAPGPSLVLVIVVDQLRRDRLVATLPGGLGRLAREGRVHVEGMLDHATTETCPGHATVLSGRHPGAMGVPANRFIDRATGQRVYCVEDSSPDAAVLGGGDDPSDGRSPRLLRFGGLGGWMKQAHARTKVFSVSAKDRSAIALVGVDADTAYWIDKDRGTFTTSRYYREELPSWVDAWNADAFAGVPAVWTHSPDGTPHGDVARPDDFDGESDEHSRTSPHPLDDADLEERAGNLWRSPYLDTLTLDFARTLVLREDLGRGERPDLLAVSLSATDTVGHEYGPNSAEARDALERLDRATGEFLDMLDARFGAERVLVALTSDHGVLALPEWLGATGEAECPVEGGRQGLLGLSARMLLEMHFELSPFALPGAWLDVSSQLTVNRARAHSHGVPVERVIEVAERWLEAQPVIREAWTEREIRTGDGPIAALYRSAFDPERSGDIAIQLEPGCLIDYAGTGTTHGTPYVYDRAVPIVFFGPGVVAGAVADEAATIDIAPTLAQLIGIVPPEGIDGRDLSPLRPAARSIDRTDRPDQSEGAGASPATVRNTSGSM